MSKKRMRYGKCPIPLKILMDSRLRKLQIVLEMQLCVLFSFSLDCYCRFHLILALVFTCDGLQNQQTHTRSKIWFCLLFLALKCFVICSQRNYMQLFCACSQRTFTLKWLQTKSSTACTIQRISSHTFWKATTHFRVALCFQPQKHMNLAFWMLD